MNMCIIHRRKSLNIGETALDKFCIFMHTKTQSMSLLNQGNKKGKKKDEKKGSAGTTPGGSKFIQKPKSGFVSKQANTGSQRGS